MSDINIATMLQVGTVLHGTYRIESYLSSGGFGNTYIAKNIEFGETYAIKEFFVKGVCQRDGNSSTISVSNTENSDSFAQQKEKFKKEARCLRSLSNPHIVKVYDLFEENGTAYYVMDYVDGENLSTRLNSTHLPLPESEVRNYLSQILDGLEAIHAAGIWHLDIKPANIMVDSHNVVKLIDFGASKQQSTVGGATMSTGISYTNGYAPSEQMAQSFDKFGPWTDFYALGATLYKLLTNQNPPSVTDLSEDESEDKHITLPMPNVSNEMKKLVVWMMQVNRLKRSKNVSEIRRFLNHTSGNLNSEETTLFPNTNIQSTNADTSVGKGNRRQQAEKLVQFWIIGLLFVLIVCGIFFFTRGCANRSEPNSVPADSDSVQVDDMVETDSAIADTGANILETSMDDKQEEVNTYNGTDIGVLIEEYLAQSSNGSYNVDFGIFSSNSSLQQVETDAREYEDLGPFVTTYVGKYSVAGITLSNSSTRKCNMMLLGPHAGAIVMVIDVGTYNDNYEDKIIKSLVSAVSGTKIKSTDNYPFKKEMFRIKQGYLLVQLTYGASAANMAIYVSGDKSIIDECYNRD